MALVKRGKTWHVDFTLDGQRYRQSLETKDWREAQAAEKRLIAEAKAGKLAAKKNEIAKLAFRNAAERFLQDRLSHLALRSVQTEKERVKPINLVLGYTQVSRITVGDVAAYIRARKTAGIANATVNRELDIIRGVLRRAKRWHHFADDIHPLPVRQNVGRALTHEEKLHLLQVAAARPEWQNAAWAASLALNTTMRGVEIKHLCWRDVNMIDRTVTVTKSKTEAGERVIPLNADAWSVIVALYRRAQAIGGFQAGYYLFPACETAHIDPTRPQTTWRTSWRHLTRVIFCPVCKRLQRPGDECSNSKCKASLKGRKSPLDGLRFHDLRHHAITELAEGQTSDTTIMSISGHVSLKMLQHYSHVRLQAKRNALDSLSMNRSTEAESEGDESSYGTNYGTKMPNAETSGSQPIDSLVELSGIEPLTSSLRTRRSPS